MAKRDKLYTVNKWNRPFFEEERKRRLYPDGGFKPFVHENLGWKVFGYNDTSYNPIYNLSSLTKLNQADPKSTSWSDYSGNDYTDTLTPIQRLVTTSTFSPQDTPAPKAGVDDSNKSKTSDILSTVNNALNGIKSTGLLGDGVLSGTKPATTGITKNFETVGNKAIGILNGKTYTFPVSSFTGDIPAFAGSAEPLTEAAAKHASDMIAKDMASASASTASKGTSFLNTFGPGLAMTAADLGTDYIGSLISPKLNGTSAAQVGNIIGKVGSMVGSGLMATGYGLPVGLAVLGAGKLIGGLVKQFGSVKNDNGISGYIDTLRASNPQGSDEFLANLQANTGLSKSRATYTDGIFTDSGENWAKKRNADVAQAYNDWQQRIKYALANNRRKQMMYAIYENSKAMGGKLNKCKCNKKSYGGYLDSATPTGFNFLSDLTNIQMQKNQNDQDMNTTTGNSFMGIPDGSSMFANGGIMIKPENKGKFTAKAKRHGMGVQQFASHVLAHKDKFPSSTVKQAVFAKNSNTWKKALGGKLNNGTDKNTWNYSFIPGASLYELGGTLQAAGSNWGRATVVEEGDTHENNPHQGVQVGVDPEGTPNLVEEGEVIFNDYVFSNRITVPKEVCKRLRIGQKKDGFTFAEAAKKLLVESKERPNDPISKNGLDANMQLLEDAQEEVKKKMEAEQAVEQFNSLPPEQQVAIMNQEGEKALDAVAQEQMAQEFNNLPPEQLQAIAQQMAMEQQGTQGPSPEEQTMMQQLMAQQQMPLSNINPEEALAQAAAMQQQAINGSAYGGKLCFGGRKFADGGPKDKQYINGARSHWETNEQGLRVLVPNTPFENSGFGGGHFGMAGGGGEWGEDPTPLMPKKRDWLAIDYKESFNKAYERARRQKKKTFWFNGKEYSTAYNPNLTKEEVEAGNNRYQTKGLIIAPWEHALGGRLFAEGGMIPQDEMATEEQYQQGEQPVEQADNEMAKYSDEELQDMIDDYQEAESGEVKVTKGKLARLRKKAEKAQAELERRHSQENEEQPQEVRQEPSQEEIQAAAQALAQQQMMEGQPQEGMPLEGVSPELAMMMQQLMSGQLMSPEEMAAAELQQLGEQYACGGRLYLTGGQLLLKLGYKTTSNLPFKLSDLGITRWELEIPNLEESWNNISSKIKDPIIAHAIAQGWTPYTDSHSTVKHWYEDKEGRSSSWTSAGKWKNNGYTWDELTNPTTGLANYLPHLKWAIDNGKLVKPESGNITVEQMKHAFDGNPDWEATNQYLFNDKDALAHLLEYLARRRGMKDFDDEKFLNKWNQYGTFELDNAGNWLYKLKQNQDPAKFTEAFRNSRFDGLLGTMLDVFLNANPTAINYIVDENGNPTDEQIIGNPNSDEYELVRPAYNFYQAGPDGEKFNPGTNYTIGYYKRKGAAGTNPSDITSDEEGNYLTVGWKPKMDYTGLALGVAPGLTGLAMQLGRGAPDMSELDNAVAAYERSTGTMVAPHLTHGLIRPAIIDPRVTENSLNARRLGTNRLLMNTGSTPSRGATILVNDANTIGQLGQAMINNWKENRAQEQAAAAFNRETATTNASILNQVDQFNAQTQAALARDAAQLRYNVAKDKIAARDAYYAGLMGNLGSVFKGGYEAWRENQRKNERDLLAASGVFGETNSLIDDWLGISKVDPKTHKVVRGYNTGMYYWINPNTGKAEYLKTPPLATNPINACGGKIKKNKKRKGYTF